MKCKQHDRNVVSGDHLIGTFNKRKLRKCFNAYCAFVHLQGKAKRYMGRILQRMDLWMKKRAMTSWRANGHLKYMAEMTVLQNENVGIIEQKSR